MATLQLAINARKIIADAKAVQSNLAGIQSSASKAFHGVKRSADIVLGPLKMLIGITATLKASTIALSAASVGAAGHYEMFKQQLRTVIQTKEDADRAFRESISFSVATPFTPEEIIRTRIELEAVGVRGGEAVERVAQAAAAMNRNILDVGRAVKSMEVEPLRNLGIMMDELYKRGISKDFRQSTEDFRAAQQELLKIFSERYSGGLGRMALTFQGLKSTLSGVVTDLRAAFGAGFLDETKLIINDLIEAGKTLKPDIQEAGEKFGDEMMMARAHIVAGFDTALKIAGQIKSAMEVGGIGQVILEAFKLGARVVGEAIIIAFKISVPLWKSIGQIVGQGLFAAIYESHLPGSDIARGIAIRKSLEAMGGSELRKMATREGFSVPFVTETPSTGQQEYRTRPGTRMKTTGELARDVTDVIQKLSIEQQMKYINLDPGQAIADSIEASRKSIGTEMDKLGKDVVADLQTFVNNIATTAGQEPVNVTEEFKANLAKRLGEGEQIIAEWRKKLEMEGQAATTNLAGNAADVGDEVARGVSDKARALAQMYSQIEIYDQRALDAKYSLLQQELTEFKRIKIEETDIERYEQERRRQLELEAAQRGQDFGKGFTRTMEDLERQRLTWGQAGAGTAAAIHSEWVRAFQGMATEGASFTDAMKGFFSDIGDAFSRLMAQMAAEALLFDVVSPLAMGIGKGISAALTGPKFTPRSYAGITTYHGGGTVGQGGPTRYFDPSMFAFAPRLHNGLRPGEFPAVLKQGETVNRQGESEREVLIEMHYDGLPLEVAKQSRRRTSDSDVVEVWLKAAENDMRVKRRLSRG